VYVSDPSLPETRTANRLCTEVEKKENRKRGREGLSPLPMPESTLEPYDDSSDEVDFSESKDPDTGVAGGSPPVQQCAGVEATPSAAGEKVPAPEECGRTPVPTVGRRVHVTTGRRMPACDTSGVCTLKYRSLYPNKT